MTKEESIKVVERYRAKLEKVEKKVRIIQKQQEYRDEIKYGYYMSQIDFMLDTIGTNLECLELTVDRTLYLYQIGFICETERYIEQDTKEEIKKVRKQLKDIDEMLEKAIS